MPDKRTVGVDRRQKAFKELSDLIDRADKLLDAGVHNEDELRQAFANAENELFTLDQIEYDLIKEIEIAEKGDTDV